MKVGSAVLAGHVVVACLFALTQGCVTTEVQNSGRSAGARHKGPWKHQHSGGTSNAAVQPDYYHQGMDAGTDDMYSDPLITSADMPIAVEPAPSVATGTETDSYIVQKGDILSQLAVDFDTTTATLVALNNLADPDVLYVGQELRVPAGRVRTVKSSSSVSKPSVQKGGTYTIQKGDTLSGIAVAAGVSIDDLRNLNNVEDDKIFAGDTLDIPSYGKVPSGSRKAPAKTPEPTPSTDEQVVEPEPAPLAMAPAVEDMPADSGAASVGMVEEVVVYPGVTLDDIAVQYSITKAEIMDLNGISDESEVKEGTTLRIPIAE